MKNREVIKGEFECHDCGKKDTKVKGCICSINGGTFSINKIEFEYQRFCEKCLEKHNHEGQAFC